ncbi:MAG: RNA-directed DNA polymerase [Clostridia bacterium]|nr:RNA-directed DNA polymerase [Clostridia bacterium]
MIIYKEFSSLLSDLGFSGKTLYSVSNHINRHYHPVKIPKANGEFRELNVPDKLLMTIQRAINNKLLCLENVSRFAMAYKPGSSTKMNAVAHVAQPVVLKLDIRHFFDHLIFPLIKEKAFPAARYSEQNSILLTFLCTYKDALPQGAPTSPTISNIIMKDFDNFVGGWCNERGIAYTRYCDDMTFSGDFDPKAVIILVKKELKKLGLYLNDKKTVVVRKGQRQSVTGIVVNEKRSIPIEYKKRIRQEMHYCMKYGVASHLERIGIDEAPKTYTLKLLGKINYVLSVEPNNSNMRQYRSWLMEQKF